MPWWTQQQIPSIWQPNHLPLTQPTQQGPLLRALFKHKSIQQADLKFAETAFVAMEEHVTGCPEKPCRPVTARFILPELSARKVSLGRFSTFELWDFSSFQVWFWFTDGARVARSFKESLTNAVLSSRACQQIMLVNICWASFANTFHL